MPSESVFHKTVGAAVQVASRRGVPNLLCNARDLCMFCRNLSAERDHFQRVAPLVVRRLPTHFWLRKAWS
eukprot:2430065-Rhodomonas_salina.3